MVRVLNLLQILLFLFFSLKLACSQDLDVNDIQNSVIGPGGTACSADATEYRNFYLMKRAGEAANHVYPAATEDDVIEQWRTDQQRETFVCYYGNEFFRDLDGHFGDVSKDFYTWCVYVYSREYDIYGCINSTDKWGSEAFIALGLRDDMNFQMSPSSPIDRGNMVFDRSEHLFLLDNSLISCRVNWPWKSGTVGVYWKLTIDDTPGLFPSIRSISDQNDTFLVVGQQKMLSCKVHGDFINSRYAWSYKDHYVRLFNDYNCTIFDNGKDPLCANVPPICFTLTDVNEEHLSGCTSEIIKKGNKHVDLYFSSPSINDTGEYTCSVSTFQSHSDILGSKSLFIVVIFRQFPSNRSHVLPVNSPSNFTCEVKAPTNSTVYWKYALNNQPIKAFDLSGSQSFIGSDSEHGEPVAFFRERRIDNYYSLFNLELMFSDVDVAFSGSYVCVVDYTIRGDSGLQNHTAQVSMDVTFTLQESSNPWGLTVPKLSGVAVGAVLLLVLLALVVGTLSLIVLVKCMRKRRQRRGSQRPPKVVLTAHNKLYTQVSINSPGVDMEFPRENLKLLEELGKGRFGRVLRAQAHGIVPNFPNLNTVAVKTTLSDSSIFQAEKLKEELKILVDLSPHDNICNLLAYCTTLDGPLYLILEYACHGNLKSYLELCSRTLDQQHGVPIENDDAAFDGYDHLANKDKSSDEHLSLYYNDVAFSPGFMKEEDVYNFAGQIACGLKHLHDMNIIHCDLAARNILIAEGLMLKISDFGMAKKCFQDCNYNRHTQSDTMIAAKWAPPEVLDVQKFSYKSDVWSFAVVIWEIASYGSHPYSDFKVGLSLDAFINHLKTGNRLAKPDGLSDHSYDKLCHCWSVDAESRPSVESLVEFFTLTDTGGSVDDFQVDLGLL